MDNWTGWSDDYGDISQPEMLARYRQLHEKFVPEPILKMPPLFCGRETWRLYFQPGLRGRLWRAWYRLARLVRWR